MNEHEGPIDKMLADMLMRAQEMEKQRIASLLKTYSRSLELFDDGNRLTGLSVISKKEYYPTY